MTMSENVLLPDHQRGDGCRFIPVPLCRQETEYTCGEACVQSLLGCYGLDYRQEQLSVILKLKPVLGTDRQRIIRFMKMLGFQASISMNMTVGDLKACIKDGIPTIIQIQAWGDNGVDYPSDWKDSHYVIACGYDKTNIFFMDPWTLGNYTYLPSKELPDRWHVPDVHYGQCYGVGLIITRKDRPIEYNPHDAKYLG